MKVPLARNGHLWGLALVVALAAAGVALADAAPTAPTPPASTEPAPKKPNNADMAWMLISTGLVMLMVPGLALFYGGLVRRKNVLGTMMHSMVALGLLGIQWVLFGYCLAFGESQGGYIGWTPDFLGLHGVMPDQCFSSTEISILVHCMYQGMFAIITPALISGALAERIRFGPYCLFILLWGILVYNPLAHWVWALDAKGAAAGWLGKMGALDFAGGTVVHVAAGVSALAAILALRRRSGYPEHSMHPNSVVLCLFGAGLLWFGWFGFNGGSALAANGLAAAALAATQVAAAAAAVGWIALEWMHKGKPTGLGFATGLVAGLVAVTPASGYVTPMGALWIGVLASLVCYIAVWAKGFLRYDDSLDAFGVHGVGGAVGAILTGVFASAAFWQAGAGSTDPLGALGSGGDDYIAQIIVQIKAVGIAAGFAFVVSFVLVKAIDLTWGFCLSADSEELGTDRAEHGEAGFDFGVSEQDATSAPYLAPRPASSPPNAERFTVVLEGADGDAVMGAWAKLCSPDAPPAPELRAIFANLTTVEGNLFTFRGGDRASYVSTLEKLFRVQLQAKNVRARAVA